MYIMGLVDCQHTISIRYMAAGGYVESVVQLEIDRIEDGGGSWNNRSTVSRQYAALLASQQGRALHPTTRRA